MLTSVIRASFKAHPYITIPPDLQVLLDTKVDIKHINGCGTETGIFSGIGVSEVGGICISAACYVHDHRYYTGATLVDKTAADIEFLHNIILILKNDPATLLMSTEERQICFNEATLIFKLVHVYGFKAFVAGKNMSSHEASYFEDLCHTVYITFMTMLIPLYIFYDTVKAKFRKQAML